MHGISQSCLLASLFHTLAYMAARRYEGLISRQISDLRVRGIIGAFYTEMIAELSPGECQALNPDAGGDEGESLSFYNASPLFVVVAILFLVAAIVHGLEWYHQRTKRINKMTKAASSAADSKQELGLDTSVAVDSPVYFSHGAASPNDTSQQLALLLNHVAVLTQQMDKMSKKIDSLPIN